MHPTALTLSEQRRLIAELRRPEAYPHAVEEVEVVETHISWVLLAGAFAYKIKKAVNLGFLDYSTLDHRAGFCAEELRLNRRTAPDYYLAALPITGTLNAPRLGGDGPALEYAVQMARFPAGHLMSEQLTAGAVTPTVIDILADTVAAFHAALPAASTESGFGTPAQVHGPVRQNFDQIEARLPEQQARLAPLREWAEARFAALEPWFEARRAGGFVRECHGDLHLGNILFVDGKVVPFDCIEFNPGLRWIDVASEIAFLAMDLEDRGAAPLAHRLLNRYLERSGDYDLLAGLAYYQAYRAMVRAKVAAIRLAEPGLSDAEQRTERARFDSYVALVERYCETPGAAALLITCGLSASGKSTLTTAVVEQLGAVRLRSDIERKRLFGLAAEAQSVSAPGGGIYTPEATDRTYDTLSALARTVTGAGYTALIDATFLERARRQRFRELAAALRLPFAVLWFQAPEATLRERIVARQGDASEATLAVLARQLATAQLPGADEAADTLAVDTTADGAEAALVGAIRRLKAAR